MRAVYWTPEARTRLKEIQDYLISQDAPGAAREVVAALLSRTRQLEAAPSVAARFPITQTMICGNY
jgi:plasmid stabilization system protein ParE